MLKKIARKPSLFPIAAGAVICGLSLYAVSETLSYLFRDVDHKAEPKLPEKDEAPEKISE